MGSKTPNQILEAYRTRLIDRKNWLREKIWLLARRGAPHGYESEEFYAIQWVLAFIAAQEELALIHITDDLQKRNAKRDANQDTQDTK